MRRLSIRMLVLLWLAFVARGLFYCVQQPIWEGFDEWAHFAYIQYLVQQRRLPVTSDSISGEVQRSLQLVPLSRSAATAAPGSISHDLVWKLPETERLERQEQLRRLPHGSAQAELRQYEAQQPPLYYLLLAIPAAGIEGLSLPARVLILRILSVLIAAFVAPLVYLAGLQVFSSPKVAVLAGLLAAAMPGLFIDVCRVGNESLSVVLVSLFLLLGLRTLKPGGTWADWLWLGVALGAALLTKAYALALIPLVLLLAVLRRSLSGCGIAYGTAFAISAWWYWRVWLATGTLSGEQLDIAATRFRVWERLASAWRVDWLSVVDEAAFSHIWIGGWSFLVVRSWMYRVVEGAALLAFAGFLVFLFRAHRLSHRNCRPIFLCAAYVALCAGIGYHAVVILLTRGTSTALGWYLYAAVLAEILIVIWGWRALFGLRAASGLLASGVVAAAALDLYTVHWVLTPYYTGLIGHRSSGGLAAFRVADLAGVGVGEVLQRLAYNEAAFLSPAVIAWIWAMYFLVTIAILATAIGSATSFPKARRASPSRSELRSRVPGASGQAAS